MGLIPFRNVFLNIYFQISNPSHLLIGRLLFTGVLVCQSVGDQVMSFLTAVERRCYCSSPLMKVPPPLSTQSGIPPIFLSGFVPPLLCFSRL